ncbi:MAG TPA: hypothetical protein VKX40_05685 [Aequorivita sp.]|nr:hypothetical protein [Aequorivita sp.]
MRKFLKITVLSFLLLGCESKKNEVDVPWFISLSDADLRTFSISDSIKKYEEIRIENVINKAQFLSYKANLSAMAKDSANTKRYLHLAVKEDSMAICKNVAEPLSLYLGKTGPNREISIPPLLDYELDYLIGLFFSCGSQDVKKRNLSRENARLFYSMRYIRIRDHWYRSPLREMDVDLQARIDKENRKLFQNLFLVKEYHQENYFKGALMLLVAHSDDAAWTEKWLRFYFDNYGNEPQTPDFIRHFRKRSSFVDNPKIEGILSAFENQHS